MGSVEDAIDAAAYLIAPFVNKKGCDKNNKLDTNHTFNPGSIVRRAISHLQEINAADIAADPNAPYDASLAGTVYGLLDLIVSSGVLPHLSAGLAFSQRPRTVLTSVCPTPSERDLNQLSEVVQELVNVLEQNGTGVQPLLSQRILPDILAALAELAFSPSCPDHHRSFLDTYKRVLDRTPTSRLLPILTTFLQQDLPPWLRPIIAKELALVPLRHQGIRHTIEFLSLSYLTKNSQLPKDGSEDSSRIPIPIDAIQHASQLLVSPPATMDQNEWIQKLAPQLLALLDGEEGIEFIRIAGQIIAGGILSRRATGAPGTIGWQLFVQPSIHAMIPTWSTVTGTKTAGERHVLVPEQDLGLALKRLSTITSCSTHSGLIRRLINPVILSVWALLNYAQERPALDQKWNLFSSNILRHYMATSCDPTQIDKIATNLFWNGGPGWTYKPGSEGGIEVRQRDQRDPSTVAMQDVLAQIGELDARIDMFVSLLSDAKAASETIGSVFLLATRRWLMPSQSIGLSLTNDLDTDPLAVLINAKLSQALGNKFGDQLASSPQHIVELMNHLLANFINEHQSKVKRRAESSKPSRISLQNLTKTEENPKTAEDDVMEEELVLFALSIISTLVSSNKFQSTSKILTTLMSITTALTYLTQEHMQVKISPLIVNSAKNLLQLIQPSFTATHDGSSDADAVQRAALQNMLTALTSPEPPDRTWALHQLRNMIQDSMAFAMIDVPSTTRLLLSACVADAESYVHTSALPVVVDLAVRAPIPVIRLLIDAFVDVDEESLAHFQPEQEHIKDKKRIVQEALDYRLRIGEILHKVVLDDTDLASHTSTTVVVRHASDKHMFEACLSLASRRGKRSKTHMTRTEHAQMERQTLEEAERAWSGPIPNLLDRDGDDPRDQADRDALLAIVQGWEDTGIEEDVRLRASALSVLSTILERRLALFRRVAIDAALQTVLSILTMEGSEAKAILRRAAILVIVGLIRGLRDQLDVRQDSDIGLDVAQQKELERVLEWVKEEDVDSLVRDHAAGALEGLEALRMAALYQASSHRLALNPSLRLEGDLKGLNIQPHTDKDAANSGRRMVQELD
ncbi:hypothetical protein ACEQ8H_006900 [Pleosporales sp. CAS-2024a]